MGQREKLCAQTHIYTLCLITLTSVFFFFFSIRHIDMSAFSQLDTEQMDNFPSLCIVENLPLST